MMQSCCFLLSSSSRHPTLSSFILCFLSFPLFLSVFPCVCFFGGGVCFMCWGGGVFIILFFLFFSIYLSGAFQAQHTPSIKKITHLFNHFKKPLTLYNVYFEYEVKEQIKLESRVFFYQTENNWNLGANLRGSISLFSNINNIFFDKN